jgi:hypothetical protein
MTSIVTGTDGRSYVHEMAGEVPVFVTRTARGGSVRQAAVAGHAWLVAWLVPVDPGVAGRARVRLPAGQIVEVVAEAVCSAANIARAGIGRARLPVGAERIPQPQHGGEVVRHQAVAAMHDDEGGPPRRAGRVRVPTGQQLAAPIEGRDQRLHRGETHKARIGFKAPTAAERLRPRGFGQDRWLEAGDVEGPRFLHILGDTVAAGGECAQEEKGQQRAGEP